MTLKSLSRKCIREIDRRAIHELGIPAFDLMENAGAGVARKAASMLAEQKLERVAVVCGSGNNGGDGFVAARHLVSKKLDLKIFVLGSADKISGDAKAHLDLLKKCPVIVDSILSPEPLIRFAAAGPLLWIDSIFGTGLTRPVEGLALQAIEVMNDSNFPILAVDIPSGLDADSGEVLGAAIKASATVTFVRPKIGFEKGSGPSHAGKIFVSPIGIPEERIEKWAEEFLSGT